jgi:hypothetical protein
VKKIILQIIANNIINKLNGVIDNEELFEMYLDLGFMFDNFCISFFEIYLD